MNNLQTDVGVFMKTKTGILCKSAGLLLASGVFLACQAAEPKPALERQEDKVSYIMGLQAGKSLKAQEIVLNTEIFLRGLSDASSGQEPLLSEAQIRDTVAALTKELTARRQAQQRKLAEDNKRAGEAFLAENGKKDGVVSLPSGLQYKILKSGSGKKPQASDTVTANYRGTLIDGTEFDTSAKRGKAASFSLQRVIKGWTEALPLMQEGAKWQIYIPSNLAYGERGGPKGSAIGPNATLIFDIELLSVQEKKTQEKAVKTGTTKDRPSKSGRV